MDATKLDAAVRKFDALVGRFDAFCAGRKDADAGGMGNSGRKRLYPSYTTSEMKKWLVERQFDPATKNKIEEEIRAREAGESKPFVVPQVENRGFKPVNKLGRM